VLFFQFALFFYGYGTYLHLGHEWESVPADHYWINTAYQHYLHHAAARAAEPLDARRDLLVLPRRASRKRDEETSKVQRRLPRR